MSRRGFFVVLEGPEGSGKSTLIGPLAERLRADKVEPVVVREPGGTRAAEIARQALLDPEHPVGPVAELFFYLAARADLVQTVIQPALAAGRVVLSDRFALSTEAYQMAAGKRQDRLDRESADFHRRVVEYYLAVKGSGVRHLDGRLPPDQLLQIAWTEVCNAAPATFRSAVG